MDFKWHVTRTFDTTKNVRSSPEMDAFCDISLLNRLGSESRDNINNWLLIGMKNEGES